MPALNKNNSAVKRIMQEARELANDPSTDYSAAPLEEDIFEWHCTLRGSPGTEFEGGVYHFRILLPAEYPFRPPSIMMLTPNGRFELNTKICVSFTNYHEELWQPAWGIRTAIIGLQGFFPLKGQAAMGVGSIEYPIAERKRLARLSREWVCPHCKRPGVELLPDPETLTSQRSEMGSVAKETQAEKSVKAEERRAPAAADLGRIFQSTMPSSLSLPELKSAPVPPSLISSPFLTSPVFNCAGEAPHIITEQDNLWLQDTVPVPVPIRTSSPGQSGSLRHSNSHRHVRFLRSCPVAPSSPPIVISSSCEPRRCVSSQSLNAYPLNHPSNFHFTPDHRRTLSLHPPPSSTRGPSAKGRHIRMRSDSDLAFAAKLSGDTREATVSSFR